MGSQVNVSLDMGMPLHHFADGSMLIASEEVGGFAHLYRLPRCGGKLEPITSGAWQVNVKVKLVSWFTCACLCVCVIFVSTCVSNV